MSDNDSDTPREPGIWLSRRVSGSGSRRRSTFPQQEGSSNAPMIASWLATPQRGGAPDGEAGELDGELSTAKLQADRAFFIAENKSLQLIKDGLREEVSALSERLTMATIRIRKVEIENSELKRDAGSAQKLVEAQNRVVMLENENADLKRVTEELQAAVRSNSVDLAVKASLHVRVSELEAANERLQAHVGEIENENADLNRQANTASRISQELVMREDELRGWEQNWIKSLNNSAAMLSARRNMRKKACLFERWRADVEHTHAMRDIGTRMILRWCHVSLAIFFQNWFSSVARDIRFHHAVRTVVTFKGVARRQLLLKGAWSSWLRYAEMCFRAQRAEDRKIWHFYKILRKRLSGAFRCLHTAAESTRLKQQAMKALMQSWRSSAHADWVDYSRDDPEIMSDKFHDELKRWLDEVHDNQPGWLRDLDVLNAHWQDRVRLLQFQDRHRAAGFRTLARLMHQSLSIAFDSFLERVHERKKNKDTIRRMLAKMTRTDLQHAWNSFCFAVHQVRELRTWQETTSSQHCAATEEMQGRFQLMQSQLNSNKASSYTKFVMRLMNQQIAAAFFRWQDNVKKLITTANVLRRCVQRMLKRSLWVGFVSWRTRVDNQNSLRVKTGRLLRRWTNQATSSCFNFWRESALEVARRRRLMTRIVSRMHSRLASIAMDMWQENVMEVLDQKRVEERRNHVLHKVVKRLRNRINFRAFSSWCQNAVHLRTLRLKAVKITLRWMKQTIKRPFERWSQSLAEKKVMSAKAVTVVRRWANACVSGKFEVWHDYSVVESRRRQVMGRMIKRLRKHSLLLVWSTWSMRIAETHTERKEEDRRQRAMAQAKKRIMHRVSAFMKRIMHRVLAFGFGHWAHKTAEILRQQQIMIKILMRMSNRLLSVAVDRWGSNTAMLKAERVEEERRFRITNRIIRRVLNRSLASAWECWCHNVHLIMYERGEDQRRQQILSKVVRRMLNRILSAALRLWTLIMDKRKEKQKRNRIKSMIVKRMQSSAAFAAMATWSDAIIRAQAEREKEKSLQIIKGKVARRFINKSLARGFFGWENNVVQKREMLSRCRRVAVRLKFARAVKCLNPWRELTKEEARKRDAMTQIISKLQNQTIANGLDLWKSASASSRGQQDQAERHRRLCLKVVKRLENTFMCAAFQCLRENWSWNRRITFKKWKAVNRWKLRASARCVDAWYNLSCEQARRRLLMNKIVKRMRNKDIFAAWGRWRDYLSRLEMVRAKERRVQLVMKNILLRMAKKLLVLGHESWRNWMVGQKRLRQIDMKVMCRIMNRTRVQGFDRWREQAMAEKRMKATARRVVDRLRKRTLVIGFDTWSDYLLELQASREAQEIKQRTTRAFIHRMANRSLASAFETWRTAAAQTSRCMKMMLRWKNMALVACLVAWNKLTKQEANRRNIMGKIVGHMRYRASAMAWKSWNLSLAVLRRHKSILVKVTLRWIARFARMFFDYWRDYTEDEARARLEHEKETISREAWVQKESALQDERDQFFQELQALQERLEQETCAAKNNFASEAERVRARLQQQSKRVIKRLLNKHLAIAFSNFQNRVAEAQRQRDLCRRILLRMKHRCLSVSFFRFIDICEERRSQRRLLNKTITRWTKCVIIEMFSRWQDMVADNVKRTHMEGVRKMQAVIAAEGRYENRYNLLKGRFNRHGQWIAAKVIGMHQALAFGLFYHKVSLHFSMCFGKMKMLHDIVLPARR